MRPGGAGSRLDGARAGLALAAVCALLAACSPSDPAEPRDAAPAAATGPAPGAALAVPSGPVVLAGLTGDAEAGRRVFARCRSCHAVEPGVNRVGPSLHAVVGRPAGSIEGFRYSRANRESRVTWSEQALFDYLADPRGYMPGTNMTYAGLASARERVDLIAYLKAN